jgi:hypothetical protein
LKTAAVTWPVTVDAAIDYNLPEAFSRRNGGAMDYDTIARKATPAGLVDDIRSAYPGFGAEWVDDRARALATMYLVSVKKPDLVLVHFVDLDSEAHTQQPYSRAANAILEYTDELIGRVLSVTPKDYVVCLTADHGFEAVHRLVNPRAATPDVWITPGLVIAKNAAAKAALTGKAGVGREVAMEEVRKYAPHYPDGVAAFEPGPATMFGSEAEEWSTPKEHGEHGFWPTRAGYRSVHILWGAGIKAARLPEIEMTSLASRWAAILGIRFP